MNYNQLSAIEKAQIATICRRNDITRPEDIEKAYNNYVEGKSIFDDLSEGYQRASAFGKFLANGGHIYDGDTEPTQQMDSRPSFPWIEMARQEEQAYQNAMQEPYFQVNGKISKDEWRERNKPRDPGQITQSKYQSGPIGLGQMIDEYVREAKYRANNGELMLHGKYGLPLAGLAAGAGAAAGSVLPTILANPYVDAGLVSMGGAHAAQSIANGEADWMTALELAPMVRPAKAVYQTAKPFIGPIVDAVTENAEKARTFLGSPATGKWTQFGNKEYRFEPGRMFEGLPINKVESRPSGFNDLIKRIASGELKKKDLLVHLSEPQANQLIKLSKEPFLPFDLKNKRNELVVKFMSKTKGQKGTNKGIIGAEQAAKRNSVEGITEGQLSKLQSKYLPAIDESANKTGVNWSDKDPMSLLNGMDTKLKMSPVGFDKKIPFIERYYKNVHEIIKPGGFQDKLLESGELRQLPNGKWEGIYSDGKYHPVYRPEEYVKVRWARDVKGADVELPIPNGINNNFPMHGTRNTGIDRFKEASSEPGENGYWTIVNDDLNNPDVRNGITYYKGDSYSIPFYRNPMYEAKPFTAGSSYKLMDIVHNNGMKILQPRGVNDANTVGTVNEYIFGPMVPNPKSSWNTLDFESGAGPFAYNAEQEKDNDFLGYNYLT